MPNTYTLIASNTVGSGGAASISFSSIPSTYTDLLVKISTRDNTGSFNDMLLTFNGSASGYTNRLLYGSGTGSGSTSSGTTSIPIIANDGASNTSNTFSNSEIYVPNYAGSNYKSVSIDAVSENNTATAYAYLIAGLWSNTAAINQITITSANTFVQYSTAYLYGIKNS